MEIGTWTQCHPRAKHSRLSGERNKIPSNRFSSSTELSGLRQQHARVEMEVKTRPACQSTTLAKLATNNIKTPSRRKPYLRLADELSPLERHVIQRFLFVAKAGFGVRQVGNIVFSWSAWRYRTGQCPCATCGANLYHSTAA